MMGLSLLLKGRWSEYRTYLIAETEALTPRTRMFYVRSFLMPWFAVLVVGDIICFALDMAFHIGEVGRAIVLSPFALIAFGGMIYASWVVMYYGIRADIRRVKEVQAKGG